MNRMPMHPAVRKSILPGMIFFGFLFIASGALLLFKQMNTTALEFLPDQILIYICSTGSIFGGLHMIYRKVWRPRIYV